MFSHQGKMIISLYCYLTDSLETGRQAESWRMISGHETSNKRQQQYYQNLLKPLTTKILSFLLSDPERTRNEILVFKKKEEENLCKKGPNFLPRERFATKKNLFKNPLLNKGHLIIFSAELFWLILTAAENRLKVEVSCLKIFPAW